MRIRNVGAGLGKIELQMAPMIDVVFQLLIFFMLTLKVIPPEGDFNINMPLAPSQGEPSDLFTPEIKVRLVADENGNLAQILFGPGPKPLRDMEDLGYQILEMIGGRPGGPFSQEIEVEIDADYHLHYQHVMQAISACTGRYDPQTGQVIKYIEKIKFAPLRLPNGS